MHTQATPATGSPLRHRIRNALLLAACADHITAPLDGTRLPTSVQLDAVMHPTHARGADVGDSACGQMLTLAGHLAEHRGTFDEDSFAVTLQNGQGAGESSAAVRAVAAGLIPASLDVIADTGRRSAALTHADPLARAAAAVMACAVAMAIQGVPNAAVTPERFLATLSAQARHPELVHYLTIVRTLARHRAGPAEAIATLATSPTALRTVPAALTAFLRHHQDPAAAIRYAAAIGGQTRAIATMAGAVTGARNPQYQPPAAWKPGADTIRIHAIAGGLAAIEHAPFQPR
ncbi:ADP-ribosylglycohydrolase family protein [Allorhizocola rhizosphaerae]|uniref:ADP-ribosylglycohydrolase family protein n=1 Tax=Allorhizocola rhizosphaerae TaxID=1872709 RepID=UPI000E3D1A80|nr:ADP-ribosylglycohydrolase family protein [Allorhizocola rhizosphaerae]